MELSGLIFIVLLLVVRLLLPSRPSKTGPCSQYYGVTCQCSVEDRMTGAACPKLAEVKVRRGTS